MHISIVKNLVLLFLILLVAVAGVLFYFLSIASAETIQADHRAGEFLVKFKNNPEIYKIKTVEEMDIYQVIQNFSSNTLIEFIEPNYIFQATAFPNDPDRPLQYYLSMINAKGAWSKELLAREQEGITRRVTIAILDTGIDTDHPDLKNKIWINTDEIAGNGQDDDSNGYIDDVNGWDFVDRDADPNPSLVNPFDEDAVKHGTIVAGIAAASTNNNLGIAGVGWFVDVMPIRVLDSTGAGDVASVIKAIDYAIANGASVINMSFVGDGESTLLKNAIQKAYDNNVIVVAAAGNTDPGINGVNLNVTKAFPVCYSGTTGENIVIGVASVNSSFKKSSFSNYGDCIDIVAPGESFYSTQVYEPSLASFENAYDGYWSGTSLSAPLVSGTVASIKALRPGFNVAQIQGFLKDSAKDIDSFNSGLENQLGSGLLDFENFVATALGTKEPINESGQVESYVIAGLGYRSFPQVKLLRTDGTEFKAFFAYGPNFNGAINIASGDVNNDGKIEVITSAGEGGGPHVRIFNIEGQVVSQFFAYEEKFRGGINIAVGDIDGDGVDEIVTGAGKGIIPEVKVFDYQGNLISKFLAYGEGFLGGVKVAVGDVDGDGKEEIITGAGAGGGPHVRIFRLDGILVSQFFAYNKNFKGGVNVASGDLHNDGRAEIIVSVETNSVPTVRVFNHRGDILSNFFAFEPNFLLGVHIAVGDADGDGLAEIVAGKSNGGNAEVRVFNIRGVLEASFNAHPASSYLGGVRPAVLE